MTVRRLAESDIQPEGFAFNRANSAWARKAIGKYPRGREHSAVIPLLMRAQEQEGWVTKAAIEHVADMIGMPYIRALEVATFYTQFQLAPVGTRAHVQVCGTTPCMLRGAQDLVEVCKRKINPEPFHTNEGGTLSWEEVECQGACVNAPMVMIFKDTFEDLTAERLEEIIDAFAAGKGDTIKPGPQVDRIASAPITGLTSLTEEPTSSAGKAKADRKPSRKSGAAVPPSRAAKPRTAAPETDPTVKSPSPVKASQNGEKAASARRPKEDTAKADMADPAVEGEARPRKHAGKQKDDPKAFHSPQTAGGDAVGPAGKRRPGEKVAKPGKPSPEGTRVARKSGKVAPARMPGQDDESGAE